MFTSVSNHAKSQYLNLEDGFILSLAVGKHSREIRQLCNPTTIFFLINFDEKL